MVATGDHREAAALRPWSFWSRAKLSILEDYLAGFLTACKVAPQVVYLDAFAGQGHGVDEATGEVFKGHHESHWTPQARAMAASSATCGSSSGRRSPSSLS